MRPFRLTFLSIAGCLLFTFAAHAQLWREHWRTQKFVAFGYDATVRLPDGWSVQERGIAPDAEKGDCQIVFAPPARGNVEQLLALRIEEDRQHAASEFHSELSRAGGAGGLRLVSVRYVDRAGRLVEKRYFEVPSQDSDTLMQWDLNTPAKDGGRDCAARLSVVAGSFRITSQPVTDQPR
jgi:hypothetical protein